MTASARIGTFPGVPDSTSISLEGSAAGKGASKGSSAGSDFHSVLEQYHAARENASATDDSQGKTQSKQKDSDSATSPAAAQPVPPAPEAPRLVLPFSTSLTLRQDATSSADDAAAQDATTSTDGAASQDSTAQADTTAASSLIASTPSTLAILRSTLDSRGLPLASTTSNVPPAAASLTSQSKSETKSKKVASSPEPPPLRPLFRALPTHLRRPPPQRLLKTLRRQSAKLRLLRNPRLSIR